MAKNFNLYTKLFLTIIFLMNLTFTLNSYADNLYTENNPSEIKSNAGDVVINGYMIFKTTKVNGNYLNGRRYNALQLKNGISIDNKLVNEIIVDYHSDDVRFPQVGVLYGVEGNIFYLDKDTDNLAQGSVCLKVKKIWDEGAKRLAVKEKDSKVNGVGSLKNEGEKQLVINKKDEQDMQNRLNKMKSIQCRQSSRFLFLNFVDNKVAVTAKKITTAQDLAVFFDEYVKKDILIDFRDAFRVSYELDLNTSKLYTKQMSYPVDVWQCGHINL